MASAVIGVLGTAAVNALAFSGSNYLFSHLDKDAYAKERKRHDQAMEELTKETARWNENRKNQLDFINNELMKRNIAARDFNDIDEAMALYSEVTKKNFSNGSNLENTLPPKPRLSDFYQPSTEARKYEYLWLLGGSILTGYLVYKFSK